MENKTIGGQISNLVIFTLVQVLLLKDLVLFNTGFCFFYISFILLLPLSLGRGSSLLIAFLYGWFIDVFYNSFGLNAAACVLIAFIRPYILKFLASNTPGNEDFSQANINSLGFNGFTFYVVGLTFIHHLVLFYGEAYSLNSFWSTLSKVIVSTFFTYFVILVSQYLFYYTKRNR